jgi:hypothetical protein
MKMKEKLVQVKQCPWCKSELRESNDIFSNKINHYIIAVLGVTSENAEEIIKTMKGYQCLLCKTTYLDPWFHPDTIAHFLTIRSPCTELGGASSEI